MALQYTNKGLPIWTLETVAEPYRDFIQKYKGVKPWLNCQSCGLKDPGSSTKLYYCTGCIKGGIWDRARYCSVACQKKDWKEHKWKCTSTAKVYNDFQGTEEERKLYCMHTRQLRRLEEALLGPNCPIEWAARQAFLHCQIENPRQTRFTFLMAPIEGMDLESPESFVLPYCFAFSPARTFETPSDQVAGQWGFRGPVDQTTVGWVSLDSPENGSSLYLPLPQWPYVFAQCCFNRDFHRGISFVRLSILVEAIRNFSDPDGLLEGFIPPKFQDAWDVPFEKLEEWMNLMGPVIGCL